MRITHVNARLSEGGAAGVARSLCERQLLRGDAPTFVYGYSKHGRPSNLSTQYPTLQLAPRAIAALNLLHHNATGKDTSLRSPSRWRALEHLVSKSDIIHLHVIHSYFTGYQNLLALVQRHNKPVVWTLHDHWAMTGRCAQPGPCQEWKTGCSPCTNPSAYPRAIFDFAQSQWLRKYATVLELQQNVPSAIVACAGWLAEDARTAGLKNVHVVRNAVDPTFWAHSAPTGTPSSPNGKTRVLFICRDLRDREKVDWEVLSRLAKRPDIDLTILGDNPLHKVEGAHFLSSVSDRAEFSRTMQANDVLLFTSAVDYYPLTIAEALTAGLRVAAIQTPAAEEFTEFPNMFLASDIDRAIDSAITSERAINPNRARGAFHPERMTEEYSAIYESIVL